MENKFSILVLFVGIFLTAITVHAQRGEGMQKIRAARIALITERLDLTPEQAEKFWPIYNEYSEQRQKLRKEFIQNQESVNTDELSEDESREMLDDSHAAKARMLELDKKYDEKLRSVISDKQLLELRIAEDDFRKMLLRRLEKRRERMNR